METVLSCERRGDTPACPESRSKEGKTEQDAADITAVRKKDDQAVRQKDVWRKSLSEAVKSCS